MRKEKLSVRVIAEIAILAAIAFVFDYIQGAICNLIPFWPNGGSVGIAMVPIIILAYRRGFLAGLIGGLIVGLLDIMDGFYVSPLATNGFLAFLSVSLDYLLIWIFVAFAGLFSKKIKEADNSKKAAILGVIGAIIGGFGKFFGHFLSGLILWDKGTEVLGITIDLPKFLYSLLYNGSYMIPCIILSTLIIYLILRTQAKVLILNENIK